MSRESISRHSLDEIMKLDDKSRADSPEGAPLGADFWASAKIVLPDTKKSVHLRVDAKVLDYFKAQGKGHLTRMNAVLRSYVEAKSGS
jgi:uncharacterized protein (DUF4415 family)